MYYHNIFNPNYINEQNYNQLLMQQRQREQQQFENEQMNEIAKMLKALNDYMDAAQKIAPQYQEQASALSVMEICKRLYNRH